MMVIAEALGLVLVVLAGQIQMRRLERFFEARLEAQHVAEEGRKLATYKMAKANERVVARSDAAVRKMVDRTNHLRDETLGLQQRMDAQIKRSEGGE